MDETLQTQLPQLREQKLHGPLEEQRARRNFLTWAFFLAQASAAELLVNGAAAKTQDDELSQNPLQHSDPQVDSLPTDATRRTIDVAEAEIVTPPASSTIAQNVGPPVDSLAQTHPLPLSAINVQPSIGAGAGIGASASAAGSTGSIQSHIGSGGSTDNSLPNLLPDIGGAEQIAPPPITVDIGLTPLLGFDVTIDAGGLISTNIGLDLNDLLVNPLETVTGLLDSLTDDLGNLLHNDVLGLGELLQSSTLNLGELTGLTLTDGIAGLLDGTGATSPAATLSNPGLANAEPAAVVTDAAESLVGGLLGSGGVINFSLQSPVTSAQADELYALGRYTDYNIALRDNAEPTVADAAPDIAAAPETPPVPEDHLPADSASGGLLHLDEFMTRPAV